MYNNILAS